MSKLPIPKPQGYEPVKGTKPVQTNTPPTKADKKMMDAIKPKK